MVVHENYVAKPLKRYKKGETLNDSKDVQEVQDASTK